MKRITAFFAAICLLLALAGCTAAPAPTAPTVPQPVETSPEQTGSTAPEAHYPLTLTDQAGRVVTIPEAPRRVVSGYYISTSLLIALGQQDKLVGIEAKASSRPIYRLSAPELLDLPNVGSAKEFDLEGCAALTPDLVILPLKLKNAAETLTSLGIPVLLVNPEDQALLQETADLVARALDCEAAAQALSAFTAEQEARLEAALSGAEKPRVYLAGNSSLLSTAGSGMYQNSLITAAGGENAAAELTDSYWSKISYEQLLVWDPDYILLASNASYTVEDVLSDPNLSGCQAVLRGNVYQLPSTAEAWDSPVPGGILGAVWLSARLHPGLFSVESCDAVIEDFYAAFYGFSYGAA